MSRLGRGPRTVYAEDQTLRLRAAWLYHRHGLTQKDIAEKLGLSRATVIRLLEEATRRGEVQVRIAEGEAGLMDLALALEAAYGLSEAIVVPEAADASATAAGVGAALGQFLSDAIPDNVTIGVGWGRTLSASLATLAPVTRSGVKVVSLVGGAVGAQAGNPVAFGWQLAGRLLAECHAMPAPAIVDSPETRRRLVELCGLDRLHKMAETLDIAILGVGDVSLTGSALSLDLISVRERAEIVAAGAVCDVLANFLDTEGRSIDHPLGGRVMSVDLDAIARAGHTVLAAGGAARAVAIRAAIRRLGCHTLVTDEGAARVLMALAGSPVASPAGLG